MKTKQIQISRKIILNLLLLITLIMALGVNVTFASCNYYFAQIICHNGTSYSSMDCCPTIGGSCAGQDDKYLDSAGDVRNTTDGFIWTCVFIYQSGDSESVGPPVNTTCSWASSGVSCSVPWGPTPQTTPVSKSLCKDPCNGGG